MARLLIESYLDMLLASITCIIRILEDHENFNEYFDGSANILNSTLTIIFIVIGLIFPVYGHVRIYSLKQQRLSEDYESELIEEYLEPKSPTKKLSYYYIIFFLFRRLATIYIVVFGEQFMYF